MSQAFYAICNYIPLEIVISYINAVTKSRLEDSVMNFQFCLRAKNIAFSWVSSSDYYNNDVVGEIISENL